MYRIRLTTLLVSTFSIGLTACQAQNNGPAPVKSAAASKSGSATASAGAASDGHTWHMKREERSITVLDYQINKTRPIKTVNMLVPVGWTLKPLLLPADLDCADTVGGLMVGSQNPEKTTGLLVLPTTTSMWSDNPGIRQQEQQRMHDFQVIKCQIAPPIGIAEILQKAAHSFFPKGEIVGQMEPVPGLSEALPGIVAGANRNGVQITAEAGRLRVNAHFDGAPVEAWMIVLATHRTEHRNGATVVYQSLPLEAVVYAPPGQLDQNDKLLMTLLSSVEIDQDWVRSQQFYSAMLVQKIDGAYAQVAKIHQQMAQDNANAAAQQQAIRNNTANYRNQVMSNVAANRSAALDHSSQQFALYMGDQAIYKDPATGEHVQMSGGYGHVWASTTGNTNDYILTDSPSYDPNGKVGSSGWTQMEVVH